MQPAYTPQLPTIGFSTNVLNHPTNTALAPADVATAVAFLSERFGAVEIEISEAAQPAILECGRERYDALVAALRDTAQRTGVRLSVHAPWFGDATNLASPSADERARSISLLSRAVDFGADIGARIVTCHPGYHEGQERESFNRHLHDSLREAVRYAASRDVQISLENMGDERPSYIVHSVEEQIAMCQATGACVTLDVIHLRSRYDSEADFLDALTRIAPYVANVHIADMKGRNHAHVPIGDGDFPLDEVLNRLGAAGYAGGAIVEEFVRNCDFQRFLDKAIDYRARFEGPDRTSDAAHLSPLPGAAALPEGDVRSVALGAAAGGSTIVVVGHGGTTTFVNSCPHTGARLDAMSPLDTEHGYLVCSVHGALFDASGRCVKGPCTGRALTSAHADASGAAQADAPAPDHLQALPAR
jgi:sugar phosphate isomerase/epimerase/nitrite reductase/ring-hydroxylating ferredoxin subunit